jgi:hypothetical protein
MLRRTAVALLFCSLLFNSFNFALAQQPTPTPLPATPPPGTQMPPPPALDPNDPVAKIIDEGMNRSQVMQTLSYLSDVIGARLTGSPNMKRANNWTREQMEKWGLMNARVEPWGAFGRGWQLKRFSAEVVEPQAIPVIAYPKAWSPGTGAIVADVLYIDAKDEAEMRAKYAGKLKGAIVLTGPMRDVTAHFDAQGRRLTEKELLDLANAPDPATRPQRRGGFPQPTEEQRAAARFAVVKQQFYLSEGAALLVDPGRGDGGTVFVQQATVPQAPAPQGAPAFGPGAPRRFNAYDKDAPKFLPQVILASEHYNRIMRMLAAGEHVRMAVNFEAQYLDDDAQAYDTVAEIPGSDPQLKDEIVMLGGHMDSWHTGTGATDNGAGVAVAMEAVRIIKALGLQPRRTIRVGLWSGEEEGLLGSRGYVKNHFGEIVTPTPQPVPPGSAEARPQPAPTPQGHLVTKPEYDRFDAYFNLDNGTGKIRGVYLQGNAGVMPIFRQWLAPFAQMGAQTLSMSNTGGTDHLSFDAIGLPGFQFIQDEIEYDTRTHHSNQDVFDRVQADDMKQAATIMAAFVYQTAQRDEKLPRKPAPPR